MNEKNIHHNSIQKKLLNYIPNKKILEDRKIINNLIYFQIFVSFII